MKLLIILAIALLSASAVTAQVLPVPVPGPQTQAPSPAPSSPGSVTLTAPPPDPKVVSESAEQSAAAIFVGIIAPPPVNWANQLLDLPDVWRTTPDDLTWNNDTIRSLADMIRKATLALVALAFFAQGASWALGEGFPFGWGRLILGAALSFGNLIWWQVMITGNNALNASINAPDVAGYVKPHLVLPDHPPDPLAVVGDVLLVLVFGIVLLLTLLSMLMRLGLLDVLIAAGSAMLLLYASEYTSNWASGYIKLAFGVTFSQVLIVIGLVTAQVLGNMASGAGAVLIAIVVLLLVRSLPSTMGMMGRTGSGGAGIVGRLIQVAVLRRLR